MRVPLLLSQPQHFQCAFERDQVHVYDCRSLLNLFRHRTGPAHKLGLCELIRLHNPLYETGVQVDNEHSEKGHLLACVFEDDPWVIRLTAEAVGGHHHSQVVDVHLSDGHVGRLRKHLECVEEENEQRVKRPQMNL